MRTAMFILALAVAPLAMAQDAVVLKRVAKEGDVAKYALKVETEISGAPVKFTANVIEKVMKVLADGTYTVSSEQEDTVLEINGETSPAPANVSSPTTSTFGLDGSVTDIQGDESGVDAYRMANIQAFLWPKEAVKEGSKWEADIKENKSKETPMVHCKYEVVGKETIGEHNVFKINFESAETTGDDPASSKGSVWVDIASGLIVKTECEWKNAPIATMKLDGKVTMTLI